MGNHSLKGAFYHYQPPQNSFPTGSHFVGNATGWRTKYNVQYKHHCFQQNSQGLKLHNIRPTAISNATTQQSYSFLEALGDVTKKLSQQHINEHTQS